MIDRTLPGIQNFGPKITGRYKTKAFKPVFNAWMGSSNVSRRRQGWLKH